MTLPELLKAAEEDNQDARAVAAYFSLIGEEYATLEGFSDSYAGEFDSDEDFARDMADNTGAIPDEKQAWPLYCIDWEFAARELMFDYMAEDGFYFRNA